MKSLLGALALITLMGAGAWSSDALSGFDAPERGRQHREHAEDRTAGDAAGKAAEKSEKSRAKSREKSEKQAVKAAKVHPHGGPPGQQQRGRGEPPEWSGGPKKRTAEPPGLADKPADHPAKTHGRP